MSYDFAVLTSVLVTEFFLNECYVIYYMFTAFSINHVSIFVCLAKRQSPEISVVGLNTAKERNISIRLLSLKLLYERIHFGNCMIFYFICSKQSIPITSYLFPTKSINLPSS